MIVTIQKQTKLIISWHWKQKHGQIIQARRQNRVYTDQNTRLVPIWNVYSSYLEAHLLSDDNSESFDVY